MAVQEQVHRHRRQRLIGVKGVEEARGRRRATPPPLHPVVSAVETGFALFTTIWVLVYFPFETYSSWRGTGLLRFSYLIDLAGMGLLLGGVVALWRGRPLAGALTASGWAWTAANFWRSTMESYYVFGHNRWLYPGRAALWLGPVLTLTAIAAIGVSFWIIVRRDADTRS